MWWLFHIHSSKRRRENGVVSFYSSFLSWIFWPRGPPGEKFVLLFRSKPIYDNYFSRDPGVSERTKPSTSAMEVFHPRNHQITPAM